MAALDGKITIGIDYRPCIVTEMDLKRSLRKNENIIRKHKALFHYWNHRSELVGESPLCGGQPAGQISGTFAIVEYEDGTIHEVEPTRIQFMDNAMSEYVFPEMEEKE